MVRVDMPSGAFCVDVYEAPGFDQAPEASTIDEAIALCSRRGARLCSEREWERACRGPDGLRYPYGDTFRDGVCRTGARTVGPAGHLNHCRSGYGVYDLSGNAAEWVQGGLLKGGDFAADEFAARCGARALSDASDAPGHRGVRCCKDLVAVP